MDSSAIVHTPVHPFTVGVNLRVYVPASARVKSKYVSVSALIIDTPLKDVAEIVVVATLEPEIVTAVV